DLVGERIVPGETGGGRVGDRAVLVDRGHALRGRHHERDGQRVAVLVKVVVEHRDRDLLVARGGGGVIDGQPRGGGPGLGGGGGGGGVPGRGPGQGGPK